MSDIPTGPLSDSALDGSSGVTVPNPPAHHRPTQIGPYRVLELLGEGGMGEVYKAERLQPIRQTVAIKVIKLGVGTREIIGRFESERQALALMDHPAIAKVFDAGTTDGGMEAGGRPYFVMEYVGGKPITQFCDENRLSIDDRLHLFMIVCDAIAHAHAKAIIHRDIKPSNVLAYMHDGKPAVKVIDFGVAKAVSGDRMSDQTYFTSLGQAIGTYDSMSPEQAEGSPDIDTRTDVYALGVLLYELLTGAKPFDRETLARAADAEIKRIIREVEPPRPSTRLSNLGVDATKFAEQRQAKLEVLAKQLRSELEWIPLKAMRKDRGRRYASPLQFKEDVQNYLDGKPLLAGPETRSYRIRKFVRRNRRGVVASTLMLLLLIAGTLFYIHNIRAEQQKTKLALIESEKQRAEAIKQEKISNDSTNFLANLFRNADPSNTRGHDTTMVEVMQDTVKKLDSGWLTPEPITESMVRYVVGTTYNSLGRYEEGRVQLQRARELNVKYRSPQDPQTPTALADLALTLTNLGKFDEAEPLYREALRLELANNHNTLEDVRNIGKSYASIGVLLRNQQKFADAEAMLKQALDYQRKNLPPGDLDTAMTLNNLAAVYWNEGKLDLAEPLCREVLKLRQAALPADHPNVAQSINNLAVLLRDEKKYDEAEPLARKALELRRKVLPPEHPDIATACSTLAGLLSAEKKYGEAEPLARETLSIRRKALPADHPLIGSAAEDLGWVLYLQDKFADAEPLYREALKIREEKFGKQGAPTTRTAGRLANLLDGLKRPSDANALRGEYQLVNPATSPSCPDR